MVVTKLAIDTWPALSSVAPDGTHQLTPEAVAQLRAQFSLPAPSPISNLPSPAFRHRLRTFFTTLAAWVRNGCPLTPAALLHRRQTICFPCPHWHPGTKLTPARCALCGCATSAKLRLLTATCPVGKW